MQKRVYRSVFTVCTWIWAFVRADADSDGQRRRAESCAGVYLDLCRGRDNTHAALDCCDMRPLVNCDTQLVAAVKPSVEALNEAGSVLVSEDKDTLYETVTSGKIAVAAASAPLETDNVQTVSRYVRYGENALAPHVIGYTNADGDGVSGVEKSYNELLKSASGTLWARCGADALGRGARRRSA